VTLTGVYSIAASGSAIQFTDISGKTYSISTSQNLNSVEITNLSGNQSLQLNVSDILGSSTTNQINVAVGGGSDGGISASFTAADNNSPLQITLAGGQVTYKAGSTTTTLSGSSAEFSNGTLDSFSATQGAAYELNQSGEIVGIQAGYDTNTLILGQDASSVSTDAANALQLEASINTAVTLDTPTGTPNDSRLSDLVVNLGTLTLGQLPGTSDPTGSVANSQILATGDASITGRSSGRTSLISRTVMP